MKTVILAATLALSACAASTDTSSKPYKDKGPLGERGQALAPPSEAPACDVAAAKPFIGQPGDAVADKARDAADATSVRIIKPGTMVTMDYRADRLNLKTDDKGVVTEVNCG
jgi:hypothetical protein